MISNSTTATGSTTAFHERVESRFGIVPNFFKSARAAPGLVEELWGFAESAYFDNPFPSLFKERLVVHLSRLCRARYCIVRHVGFLLGLGKAAGDASAQPESLEHVVELLSRPALLRAPEMEEVLSRLELAGRLDAIPSPRTELEYDLFQAASAVFLLVSEADRARHPVGLREGREPNALPWVGDYQDKPPVGVRMI